MSNSYSVITQITNESMRVAHESATFLSTIDRQYDDSYAKTGAKIGSSLRVRKPDQFDVTTTSRVIDVQEQAEGYETITLASQYHVDMYFTSDEMSLSLDRLSERKIKPAMQKLISKIEGDVLTGCTKGTYNQAGTAGTALGDAGSLVAFTDARAKINQGLAPKSNRSLQLDSVQMGALVGAGKGLFAPVEQVGKAFAEGFYARTMAADIYENERVYAHTNGTDHTTLSVVTTLAAGATSIQISGSALSVGTTFTVSGCYAAHPETGDSYSNLQQFVVTSVSGEYCGISPSPYASGAKKNVSALPTSAATVTAAGVSSTTYRTGLMYQKEAFAFVTADLPLFAGADKCQRLTQDGFSLRVWQDGDIINDRMLMRIDMLFGYAVLRPAWACKLIGAANS